MTTTDSPAAPTGAASESLEVQGEVLVERVGAPLRQGDVHRHPASSPAEQ